MEQPKVSIIVPIHNAGAYLERCLSSLVNQTLREIELILVLDCPTDGSDKLAEKFATEDNRIRLLYNDNNLHTGLSRNKGMEIARGEYIGFHDHDDYSEPTMYELLYEKAKSEHLEVVRCNFVCEYTNEEEYYKYPEVVESSSPKTWANEYVSSNKVSCVLWNHIYKTDFLQQHNIRFLDSREICSEDSIFFLDVYRLIDRVGLVPDYLYYHVFHQTNTGKNYQYRSIKNRVAFFEKIYSTLLADSVEQETILSYMSENVIRSLYTGVRQAFLTLSFGKAVQELKYIRTSIPTNENIRYLCRWSNRSILLKQKSTVILFCLSIAKWH